MPRLCVEDRHVRVLYELEGIAIAGDDDHVLARVTGPGRQRCEHVVCLVAGEVETCDAQSVEHLTDHRELWGKESGTVSRFALYSGTTSSRNVRSGRSQATAMPVG